MWALREFISDGTLQIIHNYSWVYSERHKRKEYMKYWHKGQLGKTIAEHQANVQKINEDFGFDETTTLKWKYTIIFFRW